MATLVTAWEKLATIQAYPSGTLIWARATVTIGATDSIIQASNLLAPFDETALPGTMTGPGTIIQVCDAGGITILQQGELTGLTLCCQVIRNAGGLTGQGGDITFRSYKDGNTGTPAPAVECQLTTGLQITYLVRF
jgi:hypothetical protein